MRYVEFNNGLKTYVTGEEQELIKQMLDSGTIAKKKMNEREQEVASKLVAKSIFIRNKVNDAIIYKLSTKAEYTAPY
tara:strand:+ start:574 stop:804 length:231 start_codon:yes stop_codon:yes gene_type:complete